MFSHMAGTSDAHLNRDEFIEGYTNFRDAGRNACARWRAKLRRLMLSDETGNAVMGCIALNVVFMAIEHYPQPDALGDASAAANIVFCNIFGLEMVLKLIAIGPLEYVSDGFNVFDGTIVIISYVELVGGGGGLSVLRTFRLVRVFRLISFLP